MDHMGDVPLLSRAEEARLGALIVAGRDAKQEVETADPLRRRSLFRTIKAGDEATNQFITANLRLVLSIAKRHTDRAPLDDLVQEGNIGLMHAVEKFDHTKGFKFSTYATWWIKQSIGRGLLNQDWKGKHVPNQVSLDLRRLNRVEGDLAAELGREPTAAELATELSVDEATIVQWRIWNQRPVSLDQPNVEYDDLDLNDCISDDAPTAFDVISAKMSQQEMQDLLGILTTDERTVITMRFFENPPKSNKEILEMLGSQTQPIVPAQPVQPEGWTSFRVCRMCTTEFIPSAHRKTYCSVQCQNIGHRGYNRRLKYLEHSALQKMQATLAERFIDTGDVFLSG